MTRTILHLDLDAFFCAVEENLNPDLRGKAFAVGGQPDQRGVVASCSYPARKFGVRSAMPMSRAVRLCPGLVIVHHKHGRYGDVSKQVMARLHELTPLVEKLSIDEAFLDVTGIKGGGYAIAQRLQSEINAELGLPCSFGVASNKLVAKIANTIGKARASENTDGPPNAILVVEPGQEAAFLAPLSIRELWGIGPKTADKLNRYGVQTIGDVARWPDRELIAMFGKLGGDLAHRAKGIDTRPVDPDGERKSISKETTFSQDVRDADYLDKTLRQLSDGVGLRLRRAGLSGNTVKIKLRYADFSTYTRQVTAEQPIDQDAEIYTLARQIFRDAWTPGRALRLVGVGVTGLEESRRQLSLWDTEDDHQQRRLQSTLDDLRDRFGETSIQRGSDLKPRKPGR